MAQGFLGRALGLGPNLGFRPQGLGFRVQV